MIACSKCKLFVDHGSLESCILNRPKCSFTFIHDGIVWNTSKIKLNYRGFKLDTSLYRSTNRWPPIVFIPTARTRVLFNKIKIIFIVILIEFIFEWFEFELFVFLSSPNSAENDWIDSLRCGFWLNGQIWFKSDLF